ncbi:hypothetical protein BMETH_366211212239, partial [methanotrophic bacterial endosymbiont of Bathymodiolus sp.]
LNRQLDEVVTYISVHQARINSIKNTIATPIHFSIQCANS